MDIPYVFKKCSKCGKWLVASKVNFHKQKRGKYGLKKICKKCIAVQGKQYYEDNKDEIKQYYEDNKDKIVEQQKQYREHNKDKIAEYYKQYRDNNKDKIAEQQKQYYEDNKDKIAEQKRQYRKDNKDKIAEQRKQYREDNKDKIAEYYKQWYKDNKDKKKQYYEDNKDKLAEYQKQYHSTPQGQVVLFNYRCRRRTKEQNQGNGITKNQWLECMKFFNFRCAYSDQVLSKDTRSLDHIKPLNQGGEHEIWNLVPMYKSYNSSKHDKDMKEWYQDQEFYSEERLQKIYEWQEYAYNKYSKK